jgi:GTP-binding protein
MFKTPYTYGMNITSAKFIKGVVGPDELLEDGKPQIAFIGRSNVGKSSVINTLANQKGLARTSSFPGRTQEINIYLINKDFYLADLPGYGFAKNSHENRETLQKLIYWYFFDSPYEQKKVVLIVDAFVGLTQNDSEMLYSLKQAGKNVIVVANKIDKVKKSDLPKQLKKIQSEIGSYKLLPFSAEKKLGVSELVNEVLK